MPEGNGPAVISRRLRQQLRELRENAGLSQREVVEQFDWSLSKLVRIENGPVGIAVADLMVLAELYGVSPDAKDHLLRLLRQTRPQTKPERWWMEYRDVLPSQLQQFLALEYDASQIFMFHHSIVPGLLQTDDYIEVICRETAVQEMEPSRGERLKEVRRRRAKELFAKAALPQVVTLLDEAVLRRPVGGPAGMTAQLRRLAQLTEDDKMSLGVVPFSSDAYFGMTGAFHVMGFSGDLDHDVLYLENAPGSGSLQDKPDLVAFYRQRFDKMWDGAVKGTHAIAFLETIIADFAR
ncbi:MAG: helix-turn-helix domain-containing protein [Hamadaea sp.]|nr:helix-turn-helix domain-containing protein [Hamadaea sp.]